MQLIVHVIFDAHKYKRNTAHSGKNGPSLCGLTVAQHNHSEEKFLDQFSESKAFDASLIYFASAAVPSFSKKSTRFTPSIRKDDPIVLCEY
jgi:hypothetical protein